MAALYRRIANICPSKLINVWNIRLNNANYVVTPAHVALQVKDGKYMKSSFLGELEHHNWQVPRLYNGNDISFAYDFAWAKISEKCDAHESFLEQVDHSMECEIFFRQPYDQHAVWNATKSVLASTKAYVYPSPNSSLLEALNVGFRGMSGAIVTSLIHGHAMVLGMLLRRGKPIELRMSNLNDVTTQTENLSAEISLGERAILQKLDTIHHRLEVLENKVLTVGDLDRLCNVVSMRRSIVMPCSRMLCLMQDAVDVDNLVGKLVE